MKTSLRLALGISAVLVVQTGIAQTYDVLKLFTEDGVDGANPHGGLIQASDGSLYGTTSSGGANNAGTIFKINQAGAFATLHDFAVSDGASPVSSLIQGPDGALYGTTSAGGASGWGTIFKIDADGTAFTTLHDFAVSPGGGNQQTGLTLGADGNLYGSTTYGGANDYGTIFKMDKSGATFTTLHNFVWSDGVYPGSDLVQGTDGFLYGTTVEGGATAPFGTIFKIDTAGVALTTLHDFVGSDFLYPFGALIQGKDGRLYGTTADGGANPYDGTIFRIDTDGANFTTLHSFAGGDGANPVSGLIQTMDGSLFGTTSNGGANNSGTVFETDTNAAAITTLTSFFPPEGENPGARLIRGADGNLYGTAPYGLFSAGAVFRVRGCFDDVPVTDPFSRFVCILDRDGISAGCGGGDYCPDGAISRAQMAVLLLKAEHGSGYAPPFCAGIFADVPCTPGVGFPDWIEELASEDITGGCYTDPLRYCPDRGVRRDEMAAFLLKTEHGSSYTPPACAGIFADVACTPGVGFSDWIEQLSAEGVTAGCYTDPLRYCADRDNSRGEMAVFLVKTFGLQLSGP